MRSPRYRVSSPCLFPNLCVLSYASPGAPHRYTSFGACALNQANSNRTKTAQRLHINRKTCHQHHHETGRATVHRCPLVVVVSIIIFMEEPWQYFGIHNNNKSHCSASMDNNDIIVTTFASTSTTMERQS
jgi:hypothetical protein